MFEKTDRTSRMVLGAAILLLAAAAATGVAVWRPLSGPAAGAFQKPASAPQQAPPPGELLPVTLWYPADGMLASGPAEVKRQPDAQAQARETLALLLSDKRSSSAALFRDVKLRAFYLDSAGTAYVDLGTGPLKAMRASAGEELLAVYAMVNTLTMNFEEIKSVAFILEGRESPTLAGHIDLSRKFTKRTDLVKQ